MKTITLIISLLALSSCTFSGKYASSSQNFGWSTTIVLPVEDIEK